MDEFFPEPEPRGDVPELPSIKLSAFERIVVPAAGVRLVDVDHAKPRQRRAAAKILVNVLEKQILQATTPGVSLCRDDLHRYHEQRFSKAQALDPRLRLGEFLVSLGEEVVRDDADPDPREAFKNLVVIDRSDGDVLGQFSLYNVTTSGSDPVEASAMAMPGCRRSGTLSLRKTWALIMRYLLENPVQMVDGRAFDLVEWRLPGRHGHRWDQGIVSQGILADLADHDLVQDGRPRAIRRKQITRPRRA